MHSDIFLNNIGENMYEEIDYDGFKAYCYENKKMKKNSIESYQSYLKNFINFLEDNKIYSFHDYNNTDKRYLEEKFLKTGKTKKTFGKYIYAVNEYIKFKNGKGDTVPTEDNNQQKDKESFSLNQILYGPPGTGKTYTTVVKAIEILEKRKVDTSENRDDLKKKFDEYIQNGQIKFVTFHQSYGYEEFVEGLRAYTEDKNIHYRVEDGIFKEICKRIKECKEYKKWKEPQISEDRFDKLYDKYAENLTNYSKNGTSNKKLKTSDGYEFYLYKNTAQGIEARSASSANGNPMPMSKDGLKKILFDQNNSKSSYRYGTHPDAVLEDMLSTMSYVLIIDEINRGNISKIFGELITLIEPSKRLGSDDEIIVELPYSKEKFGVPSNLYIIGTMNTADRSIALMDTALRRRFEFVEMMPEYDELNETTIEGINVGEMLKTINERIEYLYDRDHTIGHAYFMSLKDGADIEELASIFKNKILPLLQEYFYDDWEKIRLVLGESQFIKEKKPANALFKSGTDYINDKILYEIDKEAFYDEQNYLKIYNSTSSQVDEAKPANDY